MKNARPQVRFESLPKTYAQLCEVLPPRPIHSRGAFDVVVNITDAMAGHDLTTDQQDYFDLLCHLIEEWEKPNIMRPNARGVEVLQALLDARGMTAADLSKLLGVHRTLGPMLLRGERKLTLKHVKRLAEYFNVSADAFID